VSTEQTAPWLPSKEEKAKRLIWKIRFFWLMIVMTVLSACGRVWYFALEPSFTFWALFDIITPWIFVFLFARFLLDARNEWNAING
jgi:hypothetical protein